MSSFGEGEVIATRYRVRRFLARGGMGEVYAVEDLDLGVEVALKTLRPELAEDPAALENFRREVQLARKITHPNVCRLFDLGTHTSARGRVTFLTMELLDGESLHARIRRSGPLGAVEALPIVEQIADALAAAHAHGVVHRDLKSENILLVAAPSGGVRAVVTDFGLARSTEGHSAVESGVLVGTPAYVAPEQLDGSRVGPAADLYALGVVLFEMTTGRLPFEEDNPLATAMVRLRRPAPSPRRFAQLVDPRWESAILRCLERDPERRFESSSALIEALKGRAPPRRGGKAWQIAAVGLLALAAGGGLWLRARTSARPAARTAHPSVAVLDLRNTSGRAEVAWLSAALGELLGGELTAGNRLRRVAGENVTRAERDLALQGGAPLTAQAVERLRALVGAELLVSGSYRADGDTLEVEVILTDARNGRTLATVAQRGASSDLFQLVDRVGEKLRAPLGGGGLSVAELEAARASLPRSPEAARLYAEGITSFRLFDGKTARDRLAQAAELEPGFALIHAALADAWGQLGHVPEQRAEAKRAFELAGSLPRADQLLTEAKYRTAANDWPRSIELYRALADFYPDSIEYPLALARNQIKGGEAPRARETLAELRRKIPGAVNDPRVDYNDEWACENLGDYACEREISGRALERARALGSRQLVALVGLDRSLACTRLGDRACAFAAVEESLRIAHELSDDKLVADALYMRGVAETRSGQPKQALRDDREAVEIYKRLGADNNLANALIGVAEVAGDAGEPDAARRAYEEAMPIIVAVDNKRLLSAAHLGLGQERLAAGKLDEADREFEAALSIARAIHKANSEAGALQGLADVAEVRGDLRKANELDTQALTIWQSKSDKSSIAHAQGRVGGRLRALGELDRGEPLVREAVRALTALDDKALLAEAQRELTKMLLARGRLVDAAEQARASIATLGDGGSDGAVESEAMLARILVREGKLPDARAAVDRALAHPTLWVQASAALVEIAEGKPQAAVARVTTALAGAGESDVVTRIDAQISLGRAEIAAGRAAAGRARLERARADARKHGLATLAASAL